MLALRIFFPLALMSVAACSAGGGDTSGGGSTAGHGGSSTTGQSTSNSMTNGSGGATGTTTGPSGTGTTGSTGTGGEPPAIPFCKLACSTPQDCAMAGIPAYDASHYACNGGGCDYTGCKSDAECTALLQKPGACRAFYGSAVPVCVTACTTSQDCALPNLPAYDASHYTCNAGACEYTGCKSDAECTATLQSPGTCRQPDGFTIPSCFSACSASQDCAIPNLPAYDATHYACTEGACSYTGCKSDAECSAVFQKPGVCG